MKEINISVRLSKQEYDALENLSNEANVTKSEYLRLIVQGIWIGQQMSEGNKPTVEMGGYGYSFKPEQMEELFKEIGERLVSCIDIKPIIGQNKRVRYKNIKTHKRTA
jgi:predicted transcriptional regulator